MYFTLQEKASRVRLPRLRSHVTALLRAADAADGAPLLEAGAAEAAADGVPPALLQDEWAALAGSVALYEASVRLGLVR